MSCGKTLSARQRPRWLLLLGTGLVLLAGCDGGPKRYHLSGRVLYDGKPMPAGEIFFDPDITKGNDGPQGFARIANGQYDTRQGGKPAAPGPHVVRITGFDGQPTGEFHLGRPLFPEYSTTADIQDRADATFDFDVPARRPARK